MTNPNKLPFFFIIGRPRSGTTLIRMVFDAHPNVNIPIESPFIVSMYSRYKKVNRWNDKTLRQFYDDLFSFNHFTEWTIDEDRLKNELSAMTGEHSFNELIQVVYSNYNSMFPKEEILLQGDKNPYFTLYINKLAKIFPEAKFLFIYRDYRDHFYSMSRVDFEADIPALIGWRWKYFVRDTERFIKKYPQKSLRFRYEDFVDTPDKYLKQFCEFLNIPVDQKVLNYYTVTDTAKKFYAEEMEKYHTSLMKPVNKSRIGLWKKNLSVTQVKDLDCVVGKWAAIAGYEKKYTHTSIFTFIKTYPIVIYGNLMYAAIKMGDVLPYNLKMSLLGKMNIFLRFYQNKMKKKK